jgi:rhomboid protease GluP
MDSRRMCPNCRAFITSKDRICPYCREPVGPRAVDRRNPADLLGGLISHARITTTIFVMVNVALFLGTVAASMSQGNGSALMGLDIRTLLRFGAKYPPLIAEGQWWRIVTAGFLHGGLLHIAMNLWVLMDLGPQVEELYGTSRYVVVYLVSSAAGFLLSSFWSPAPSVGASAALFGLIGAMIALGVRSRHTAMGAAIRGMYIRWAIYGLLFGVLPYFHIDNAAHLGGLGAGFAIGYVAGTPKLTNTSGEKIWYAAAWITGILTAFCFLRMYLSFGTLSI